MNIYITELQSNRECSSRAAAHTCIHTEPWNVHTGDRRGRRRCGGGGAAQENMDLQMMEQEGEAGDGEQGNQGSAEAKKKAEVQPAAASHCSGLRGVGFQGFRLTVRLALTRCAVPSSPSPQRRLPQRRLPLMRRRRGAPIYPPAPGEAAIRGGAPIDRSGQGPPSLHGEKSKGNQKDRLQLVPAYSKSVSAEA